MAQSKHFREFIDTNDDEIEELLRDSKSKNTQRSTQTALRKFKSFLLLHNMETEPELLTVDLPKVLTKFYTDARSSKTGERFQTGSLKVIRAGLNRHFKITRNIDIVSDEQFRRANMVFEGVQVRAKREGKGVTRSTPHISEKDLITIGGYFCVDHMKTPNPKKLQQAVLFYIMYYFCRRGQENLYAMKKNHFEVVIETDGTKYVQQLMDEKDKNHGINDTELAKQGRMYEQKGK